MIRVSKKLQKELDKEGYVICRAPRCGIVFRPETGRKIYCCDAHIRAAEEYRNSKN